ncbi:MAG TPA: helix-turn-helix domain-containing protein [Streptosporangiaceae bacterium]|jgi:transcriptional regulator with XRE-family HTH domain
MADPWGQQMAAMGAFIRSQRQLANLSLRQLAEMTSLSNAYLSQLERGMHQPSVRVLQLLAGALDVSAEMLLAQAGLVRPGAADGTPPPGGEPRADPVEAAILAQGRLDDEQKAALLGVYHSMLRPARPGR